MISSLRIYEKKSLRMLLMSAISTYINDMTFQVVITSNVDDKNTTALMVAALHDVDHFMVEEGILLLVRQQIVQQWRVVAFELRYSSHLQQK